MDKFNLDIRKGELVAFLGNAMILMVLALVLLIAAAMALGRRRRSVAA